MKNKKMDFFFVYHVHWLWHCPIWFDLLQSFLKINKKFFLLFKYKETKAVNGEHNKWNTRNRMTWIKWFIGIVTNRHIIPN
jgi:hypothetical protein